MAAISEPCFCSTSKTLIKTGTTTAGQSIKDAIGLARSKFILFRDQIIKVRCITLCTLHHTVKVKLVWLSDWHIIQKATQHSLERVCNRPEQIA